MVSDTPNDDLFKDNSGDDHVLPKFLYVVYEGVNSSYSKISIDYSIKYEYLILPEVKHLV